MLRSISGYALFVLALLVAVILEAAGLAEQILFPYSASGVLDFSGLDNAFFSALGSLSPLLLLGLLYGWGVLFLLKRWAERWDLLKTAIEFVRAFARRTLNAIATIRAPNGPDILRHPRLLLGIGVAVSALLAYFPYRPDLNPQGTPVGVDTQLYIGWVQQMLQRTPLDAISYTLGNASQGSRPLPLIALYSAAYLGGFQAEQVVKFFPVVLGPLLVVSSFFFVRKGVGNDSIAGVSALLTAFSFNITVGMWASYYANWLGIAEVYFFSAFLLVYSRSRSTNSFLAVTGFSLALLFTHPWTWGLITSVGIVFALADWRTLKDPSLIGPAVSLAIVGLIADILKSQLLGSTTLAADLSTKAPIFGLTQLSMFWPNTVEGVLVTYGGLLANSAVLALALISILFTVKLRNRFELFLTSWIATVSIPFLFFDSFHQTRLVYDMPIPVLSSLGLAFILSRGGEKRIHSLLILLLVLLFNANYAVSAIAQI